MASRVVPASLADNEAVLAQDAVGEAGFAHVGAADDGDWDASSVLLPSRSSEVGRRRRPAGRRCRGRVHGRRWAAHPGPGYRTRKAPWGHSPVLSHLLTARTIGLWRCAAYRPLPGRRRSGLSDSVRHHDDAVSGVNGDLCLLTHVGQQFDRRLGSMPPVSTSMNLRPHHSQFAENAVAGDAGVSSTMARRWPMSLLNRVDLPTFGAADHCYDGFAHRGFLLSLCSSSSFEFIAGRCGAGLLPHHRRPPAAPRP